MGIKYINLKTQNKTRSKLSAVSIKPLRVCVWPSRTILWSRTCKVLVHYPSNTSMCFILSLGVLLNVCVLSSYNYSIYHKYSQQWHINCHVLGPGLVWNHRRATRWQGTNELFSFLTQREPGQTICFIFIVHWTDLCAKIRWFKYTDWWKSIWFSN